MNRQTLISYFLKGAGLAQNDSDSTVAIGLTTPIYCPEGVKLVMKEHCAFVDKLLAHVPTKHKDFDRLLSIRGFTHAEWLDVFNLSIKEDDFIRHHIFDCLSITTEQQRRRYILRLSPESDEDYVRSLVSVQSFHAYAMKHFFLVDVAHGSYQYKGESYIYHWPYRQREVKTLRADVLRAAKEVTTLKIMRYGAH